MTDWELWACAHNLREQHGDVAQLFAAMRCDAMLELNDLEDYRV